MGKCEFDHFEIIYNFDEKLQKHMSQYALEDKSKYEFKYINEFIKNIKDFIPTIAKKCAFQYEISTKTFNHHILMIIKLLKRTTLSTMENKGIIGLLKNSPLQNAKCMIISKEIVEKNNWNYKKKIDTGIDNYYLFEKNVWTVTNIKGVYKKEKIIDFVPKQFNLKNISINNYQQEIIKIAKDETNINSNTWNDSSLNYIFDIDSKNLKSKLVNLLKFNDLGLNIINIRCIKNLKLLMKDIYDSVLNIGERNNYIICIDFEKCLNKNILCQLYSAIEEAKEGIYYDYNMKEFAINCPSIWIFSNYPLDLNCVNEKKYKLWEIKNNQLLPLTIEDMEYIMYNYSYLQKELKEIEYKEDEINIQELIKKYNITNEDEIKYLYKKYRINDKILLNKETDLINN